MNIIDAALHEIKMAFVLFANAFSGLPPICKPARTRRPSIQALSDFVRFRKGLHQDSSLAQTLNAPSGGNRTEILASCIG